jgi:hypothetical protein
MPTSEIDLTTLFNTVAKELKNNQTLLNEADDFNHNHGDNMVKNFKVIMKALKEKKDAPPTDQLEYASQALQKRSTSGSAQLYAQGLAKAAESFQGQRAVTPENALTLVQALMGAGKPAQPEPPVNQATSGDMMGQLLGSLLGGGMTPSSSPAEGNQPTDNMGDFLGSLLGGGSSPQAPASQPAESPSPDLMGGLLGSLLGGGATAQAPQTGRGTQSGGGFDLSKLLTMGMAYMQANQQGASPIEAIIKAIMSGSQMNNTPHHSQSGQLVTSTLLNTIGAMLGSK